MTEHDTDTTDDDSIDIEIGDRVRAMQAIGGGWSKEVRGEVVDMAESPLPHYDGTEVIVDGSDGEVPVRIENVEERLDGDGGGDGGPQ